MKIEIKTDKNGDETEGTIKSADLEVTVVNYPGFWVMHCSRMKISGQKVDIDATATAKDALIKALYQIYDHVNGIRNSVMNSINKLTEL